MTPEIDFNEFISQIHDTDAAHEFLSDDERQLLEDYNRALDELYPEGIPDDQSEAILERMAAEFPGVDEVIDKVLKNIDNIGEARRKSGKPL